MYLSKNQQLNIDLSEGLSLDVIEVTSKKVERIEETSQMSKIEVPVSQIQKMPSLLGENDILKAIQLLPGVQSGSEGQSGLYVRGGSPDQNLILLDGVNVYNPTHLVGFFSVFNADAIKSVNLTKGGFPARYGGRLSSVLEIYMKDGHKSEWHGEGGIGLISSKITLEGPIKKEKTTLLFSGRRTYADLIAKPLVRSQLEEGESANPRLFFYDLNLKLTHQFNDKHRIYFSNYLGKDVFTFAFEEKEDNGDRFSFDGGPKWGNYIGALRWNYVMSPKVFSNLTATYSRYQIDIDQRLEEETDGIIEAFSGKYRSGINDIGLNYKIDYLPNANHTIRTGIGATHHEYKPGALEIKIDFENENIDTLLGTIESKSIEYAAFVEDDMSFGSWKINAGLHFSAFQILDKDKANYFSLQPRLGIRKLLPGNWAIKASYSQMQQYINLLTSEALSLPTDLWVPSTKNIKPQKSWQTALGLAKTIGDDYEISIEGYYKKMDNVVSYKEGASYFIELDESWEDRVTQGSGKSYGLEVFLQKKYGKFSGWLGYTLSWNYRTFDEINGGREFPYRYDRRHDISLVGSYDISDRISLSANWVYGTGNSISLPTYSYYAQTISDFYTKRIAVIEDKNSFRMAPYHRLDVSISFSKKLRKHTRTWIISAYNAYNRKNPFFIYNERVGSGENKFTQINLYPIIPSVTYKFKF